MSDEEVVVYGFGGDLLGQNLVTWPGCLAVVIFVIMAGAVEHVPGDNTCDRLAVPSS